MGITNLMDKLHHKSEEGAPVPKPSEHSVSFHEEHAFAVPKRVEKPAVPVRRWGTSKPNNSVRSAEAREMGLDKEGIIVDIGENMSVNLPIKKRMSLQEFLKVCERVKRIEELLITHHNSEYDNGMDEY